MFKKAVILVFLLMSSVYGGSSLKMAKDFPTAIELGKKQKKQVMLFIYSSFCPYCDRMKQRTLKHPKVVEYINTKYIFVMEHQDSVTLPERFESDYVPITYIVSYKSKDTLNEIPGYKKPEQFMEMLDDCITD